MTAAGTNTSTSQDHALQSAVEHELGWAPEIDATSIGVTVRDGVVGLTGQVTSFSQKVAAARAALRMHAVTAVANDISVHHAGSAPSDLDIGKKARAALDATVSVPAALIKVEVRNRWLILTGEVPWNHQRVQAQKIVSHLAGIRGVANQITLTERPRASAAETQAMIGSAFARLATLDAGQIQVHAVDDVVELTGTVSSAAEKHQAELAAWSSPHVGQVHNNIVVRV